MSREDNTEEMVVQDQSREIERLQQQITVAEERADALASLQLTINNRIHELWIEWGEATKQRWEADESMDGIQDRMQRLGREIYYVQQQVQRGTPDSGALRLLRQQIEDLGRLEDLSNQALDADLQTMRERGEMERG